MEHHHQITAPVPKEGYTLAPTDAEYRFKQFVDDWTRDLPDYNRGITSVFALAAFRAGQRSALEQQLQHPQRTATRKSGRTK